MNGQAKNYCDAHQLLQIRRSVEVLARTVFQVVITVAALSTCEPCGFFHNAVGSN